MLRPGDTVVYAFEEEGIYEYYCMVYGEEMCEVVVVDDKSLSESLPCE